MNWEERGYFLLERLKKSMKNRAEYNPVSESGTELGSAKYEAGILTGKHQAVGVTVAFWVCIREAFDSNLRRVIDYFDKGFAP